MSPSSLTRSVVHELERADAAMESLLHPIDAPFEEVAPLDGEDAAHRCTLGAGLCGARHDRHARRAAPLHESIDLPVHRGVELPRLGLTDLP